MPNKWKGVMPTICALCGVPLKDHIVTGLGTSRYHEECPAPPLPGRPADPLQPRANKDTPT
jgi:hypothetical protein